MTFLAKKEIGAPALGGRLARLQGVIFVDRGRRRCIPAVNAEMARAMVEGEPVVLFAEATTGDGNRLLPLPLLAFRGGQARRRRGRRGGDPAGVPRLFAASPACRRSPRAAAVRLVRRHDFHAAFPALRRRRARPAATSITARRSRFRPKRAAKRSPAGPKLQVAPSPARARGPPIALFSPAPVRRRKGRASAGDPVCLQRLRRTPSSATTRRMSRAARRVFIKSFGCQMNVYDSQRMADVAGAAGLRGDGERRGRRPRHPQHLPHPRARLGEDLSPSSASCAN